MRSYIVFFFTSCYANVQRNVTWGYILLPDNRIGPRETWLSPCSIWRCCVTTVWRFEFLKVCCVFVFCQLLRPIDLTRFRRVIGQWVSSAKRKTSARRSKRINPPKITLPTQFLRRIEEEMLKVHASSLATQFRPQCLRYDTFISRLLISQLHSLVQRERDTRKREQKVLKLPGDFQQNLNNC